MEYSPSSVVGWILWKCEYTLAGMYFEIVGLFKGARGSVVG
jgi:hypothetical protein